VLVRLAKIDAEALKGLLMMAHHYVTRGGRGASKSKR